MKQAMEAHLSHGEVDAVPPVTDRVLPGALRVLY